jgi:hypothetical protein
MKHKNKIIIIYIVGTLLLLFLGKVCFATDIMVADIEAFTLNLSSIISFFAGVIAVTAFILAIIGCKL